jgi:hypothetical protein
MKLIAVKTRGLRGVPDVELQIGGQDGSTTPFLITGPSGSGKTRLLEAIIACKEALGGYGRPPSAEGWIRTGRDYASIETGWVVGGRTIGLRWGIGVGAVPVEVAPDVRRVLSHYVAGGDEPKVEYFDAGRQVPRTALPGLSWNPADVDAAARLTKDSRKYAWVRDYLVTQWREGTARIAARLDATGVAMPADRGQATSAFERALAQLTPRLRFAGVQESRAGARVLFSDRSTGDIELSQLCDGDLAVVLFAAGVEALGLQRSLVLIDLPERAIHPEDQRHVFDALVSLVPHGQIIAATTSPAILRAAPRDRVAVLSPEARAR